MTNILPLQNKIDSAKYSEVKDNPALTIETESGYEYTRPKYTSKPKKTWTIGFTNLLQSEKEQMDEFWDLVMGGSDAFEWTDPTNGKTYNVRFKSQITWKYKGAGSTIRWDADSITIKEV